jgi:hypothetical protein
MMNGWMAVIAKRQVAKGQAGVGHGLAAASVLLAARGWICDVITLVNAAVRDSATEIAPRRLGQATLRSAPFQFPL